MGFLLNGVLYPNNSVVDLTDIGQDTAALYCLTDLTTCCRGADGGSAGEWFLAGQTQPVVGVNRASFFDDFTRGRGPSAVLLNRRNNAAGPTGVYTCMLPDGSGQDRTLYIGVDTGTVM